jgi:hypothetical protein
LKMDEKIDMTRAKMDPIRPGLDVEVAAMMS